ncbi:MAG TPA: hypothetical protein ENJ82_13850 [Bacteroidetes bacterium]|nr:hypothetical protein [Bacteroidota bacterium]
MASDNTLILMGRKYFTLPLAYYYHPEAFRDTKNTFKRMNSAHIWEGRTKKQVETLHPEKFKDIILVSLAFNLKDPKYFPLEYLRKHYCIVDSSRDSGVYLHQFKGVK